ncbi:hypothetical protein [Mycoplasmopsis lipofaciens]|uniref:hypothetical protein n=1 Tax=Mycoplasmopsis lipofaciens TaxID=114884 RepID=UPI000484B202|nr:hypothetical protein [Mycoplasmopsis lipofaciens]
MKRRSNLFIIPAFIHTSLIIILFIIGFTKAVKGNVLNPILQLGGAIAFILVLQLFIAFFIFIFKQSGYKKGLGQVLLITLILFLIASVISLVFTIVTYNPGNITKDGLKALAITSSVVTWVLALPFLALIMVYVIRQ